MRDGWQVTRRLTINLGLRYDYYPLINRGDRGILENAFSALYVIFGNNVNNTLRLAESFSR